MKMTRSVASIALIAGILAGAYNLSNAATTIGGGSGLVFSGGGTTVGGGIENDRKCGFDIECSVVAPGKKCLDGTRTIVGFGIFKYCFDRT